MEVLVFIVVLAAIGFSVLMPVTLHRADLHEREKIRRKYFQPRRRRH